MEGMKEALTKILPMIQLYKLMFNLPRFPAGLRRIPELCDHVLALALFAKMLKNGTSVTKLIDSSVHFLR